MNGTMKLGIAACLLGQKVRYDGGQRKDPFLTEILGRYVEFVPVCPEVECGLPVPREAMHLEGDPGDPKLVTIKTRRDLTGQMKSWAEKRLDELEGADLCGYVFKAKSPSSGMERIKVYDENSLISTKGVGLWARMFMDRFEGLPVEDEGRLHDPELRENFIERIFVIARWKKAFQTERTLGRLMEFHTRHKLLLMAHSPEAYRTLGRLVAQAHGLPMDGVLAEYFDGLTRAMKLKATVKKNVNVLHHLLGYFKKQLTRDEKEEFLEIAEEYARGLAPLIVPVTLMNHYVRKYDQPYLKGQYYLNPHPHELKLRNHA